MVAGGRRAALPSLPVTVPTLPRQPGEPYWRLQAEAAGSQVAAAARPLVLIGHSGACPLLRAIGAAIGPGIAAYILVDGDLPLVPGEGGSRLDMLRAASPPLADELEALLDSGGAFPTWSDEELRGEIPDPQLRASVAAEVRPQPRRFWTEALPAIPGWADAPCGYLELSPHYAAAPARAREQGWAYRHLRGGHFEMLVRPARVTEAILELACERQIGRGGSPPTAGRGETTVLLAFPVSLRGLAPMAACGSGFVAHRSYRHRR